MVDDEAVGARLVVEVLRELGYRALEAADGPAALHAAGGGASASTCWSPMSDCPADERSPGRRGRRAGSRPGLKVLFITGYAENAALAHGFLEPGMELITKPFVEADALARRVRALIEGLEQTPIRWGHLIGVICSTKQQARAGRHGGIVRRRESAT